jgi:hypothetical protein
LVTSHAFRASFIPVCHGRTTAQRGNQDHRPQATVPAWALMRWSVKPIAIDFAALLNLHSPVTDWWTGPVPDDCVFFI